MDINKFLHVIVTQHFYEVNVNVGNALDYTEANISPGTMYGTLSKMEKDGLISFVREEEKRKIYCATDLGRQILDIEIRRIERLYQNTHPDRESISISV